MTSTDAQPKLTTKQELFVAAYLGEARGNATEAARIAGYKQPKAQGTENLAKPAISARVREYVADKFSISADAVLGKIAEIAFAPSFEFVEVLSRDQQGKPLKVRMDLTNQVKALELLGKYHQLFTEKHELDVNVRDHRVGVPQSALEAMFRPAERPDA